MEKDDVKDALLRYGQPDIVSALQKAKAFDIWTKDSPIPFAKISRDGLFEKVNEALCRFFKLPETEILGKSFAVFSQEPLLSLDLAEVKFVIDGRKEDYIFAKTYKNSEGKFIFAIIHPVGFRTLEGEFDHFWTLIIPTDQETIETIQTQMWGGVILPPELTMSQRKNSLQLIMNFLTKYKKETAGAAGTITAIIYAVYETILKNGQ